MDERIESYEGIWSHIFPCLSPINPEFVSNLTARGTVLMPKKDILILRTLADRLDPYSSSQ
jgi:hypothetical protein